MINPYQLMLNKARQLITVEMAQKYLNEIDEKIDRNSNVLQTHPSLSQRVIALNQDLVPFEFGIHQSLLEIYFYNHMNTFLAIFDDVWKRAYAYQWVINYNNYQKYLNYQAQFPLPFDAMLDYAELITQFESLTDAVPILHQIIQQEPNHILANIKLGDYYLNNHDHKGIDYLRKALVEGNNSVCFTACHIANAYIKKNNLPSDNCFNQYLKNSRKWIKYAQAERQGYNCSDTFLPHALNHDAIMQMNHIFISLDRITRVYLFKKQVRFLPDKAMFIIIVGCPNMQYLTKNNLLQRILLYLPPGSTILLSIITRYTGNQVLTNNAPSTSLIVYDPSQKRIFKVNYSKNICNEYPDIAARKNTAILLSGRTWRLGSYVDGIDPATTNDVNILQLYDAKKIVN